MSSCILRYDVGIWKLILLSSNPPEAKRKEHTGERHGNDFEYQLGTAVYKNWKKEGKFVIFHNSFLVTAI